MEKIFLYIIVFIIVIVYIKYRSKQTNRVGNEVQKMVEYDGYTFQGWKSPSGSEWNNCPFKEANRVRISFVQTKGIPRTREYYKIFKYMDNDEEKIGWVKITKPPFEKHKIKIKYI